MTEYELRKQLVTNAEMYVGVTPKGGENHMHVIDLYNTQNPLPRGYKVKYTDSWCMAFVTAMFMEVGLQDLIVGECGCGEFINKNKAIFVEDDSYHPQIGDLILFDWQDTGIGDNQGWADHIGIVKSFENNVIETIEGNSNKNVSINKYVANQRYIRGFVTPNYKSKATEEKKPMATLKKNYFYIGADENLPKCNIELPDGNGVRNYMLPTDTFEVVEETDKFASLKVVGTKYTWTPWIRKDCLNIE